jgi:PAS domain S-box-containing protein
MIRSFKKLKIWTKLSISSAMFALPIAVLFYLFFSDIQYSIRFSTLELYGNRYQRPLQVVLTFLPEYSMLGARSDSIKRIDQAFESLLEVNGQIGKDLQFTEEGLGIRNRQHLQVKNIMELWEAMKATGLGEQDLLSHIKAMIAHCGDTSNLILDPDLDSYYLMDVTLLALPQTQYRIAEILRYAEQALASGAPVGASEAQQFYVYAALLESEGLARIRDSIAVSFTEDPNFYGISPTLVPKITPALDEYTNQAQNFIDLLRSYSVAGRKSSWQNLSSQALELNRSALRLWKTTAAELDLLLGIRVESYKTRRFLGLILTTISLFLAVLAVLFIGRNEEALNKSEEHFRLLYTAMDQGLAVLEIIVDSQGKSVDYVFLNINDSYTKMFGVTRDMAIGKRIREVMPKVEQYWIDVFEKVALTGEPNSYENYLNTTGRYYSTYAYSLKENQLAVLVTDITERKLLAEEKEKLQEQLAQAQKMESIGKLAGGIAHDFNNQLTGISGYAEMLASSLDNDTLKNYAQNIFIGAQNSAKLTQQLLYFARKGQYKLEEINLHKILDEVIGILTHTVDKRIKIHQNRTEFSATTVGDTYQIQNAILNISLNARDSISGNGSILFESNLVDIDENSSHHLFDLKPGSYVCISIKDNGCGMDESIQNQIFEPFFTTKEIGKGTGMGLSSAYGTVRHHGGGIFVESIKGVGSTFHILLPYVVL